MELNHESLPSIDDIVNAYPDVIVEARNSHGALIGEISLHDYVQFEALCPAPKKVKEDVLSRLGHLLTVCETSGAELSEEHKSILKSYRNEKLNK